MASYTFSNHTVKVNLKDHGRDLTEAEQDMLGDFVDDFMMDVMRDFENKLKKEFPDHEPVVEVRS